MSDGIFGMIRFLKKAAQCLVKIVCHSNTTSTCYNSIVDWSLGRNMKPQNIGKPCGFLKLPVELRLKVYDYLFTPSKQVFAVDHNLNFLCSCRAGRTFDDVEANHWWVFAAQNVSRKKFVDFGDSSLSLFIHSDSLPELALLRVSRQIHGEATEAAYGKIVFDFKKALPSVIAFFRHIGPTARGSVRELQLSPSPPEQIRCWDETRIWGETCSYISNELRLKVLDLSFTYLAGRNWKADDWKRELELDGQGRLRNKTIQKTVESASDSTVGYVAALDPQTGMPICQDFLETLPIESPTEEKRLLKTDPSGDQPIEPTLQSLVRIKRLKQINWTIKGGLSRRTRAELQRFMGARMIEQE